MMLTSWQNPMATPPFAPPQPGAAQAQSNAPWLDRLATGLLGTPAGDMTPEQQKAARQQGLLALGAQLMAGSGPSATPVSFGQALGPALMAGQQAQRQYGQDMLAEMLLKTKLQQASKQDKGKLVQIIGPDGKPTYAYEADAEGKTPYAKPGTERGAYQPGDYTPESWAKFVQTGDPSVLVRYQTPRQEFSPSFQNVTRTKPDGSTEQGTFNTRTGEYNWSGQIVPAGQKARVDAQGRTEGEAAGAQSTKAPAAASMDYVLNQFDSQFEKTMQGGPMGITGRAGIIFDYGDAVRFDNLREQLSTELRTVYRIPGEGTLSDKEQAQYGIQLPNRSFPPSVNKAIVADLRERTKLRLETPPTGASGGATGSWGDQPSGNVIDWDKM